jgi:RNA polymerase sigma factor (sigma-70 family)
MIPWLADDILQEARYGFMYALLKKYDINAGTELTTYCAWWVRHYIDRFIDDVGRTIRVPPHTMNAIRKAVKLGANTLSEAVDLCPTNRGLTDGWAMRRAPLSLDRSLPMDDGMGSTLAERLPDNAPSAEDKLSVDARREAVLSALESLKPQERLVIEELFIAPSKALCDDPTLRQVGARIGLTRSRIGQIKDKALCALAKHLAKQPGMQDVIEELRCR